MLKIGWSRKDISTEKPVPLAGQFYLRDSKFILDPIYATALTIDDGNDYVIFMSVDIVNINKGILSTIRKKVGEINPEIDPDKIIMNCTHSHSGPWITEGDYMGQFGNFSELPHDGVDLMPPYEYYRLFIGQCVDAVIESFESRKDGAVSYGYGYAVASHNRRAVYFHDITEIDNNPDLKYIEGTTKMYGKTNLPDFSGLENGGDPYANFMFTFDTNDNLTGAIVNIPCPSQNMELEYSLSSDFWADVRRDLSAKYGDIFILTQCAAAGDLAPRPRYYEAAEGRRFRLKYADVKIPDGLLTPKEFLRRRDISEQICNAFNEVYEWASKEKFTDIPIYHTVKMIDLEKRFITDEEYEWFKNRPKYVAKDLVCTDDKEKDFRINSEEIALRNWDNSIAERYEEQKTEPNIPMELHTVRIGNIAFASNMFELYQDFAHRIQGRSPFEQTFIIQLCGQPHRNSGTYLATERATKGRGYSAHLLSNVVSPKGGQQLVEETLNELNKLYNK